MLVKNRKIGFVENFMGKRLGLVKINRLSFVDVSKYLVFNCKFGELSNSLC